MNAPGQGEIQRGSVRGMTSDRFCSRCGALVLGADDTCPQCGNAEAHRNTAIDAIPPAAAIDRTAATVVDLVPTLMLAGAALIVWIVGGLPGWLAPALGAAAGAWFIVVCGWEMAGGSGPGKQWRSLTVIDDLTGDRRTPTGTLLRQLVRLGSAIGTVGFAGLSYRWDPTGRERTWWDRAAGTRVVSNTASAPAATGSTNWPSPVGGWTPDTGGPPAPAGPAGSGGPSWSAPGQTRGPVLDPPRRPAAASVPPAGAAAGSAARSDARPPDGFDADPDATTVISGADLATSPATEAGAATDADAATDATDATDAIADEQTVALRPDELTVNFADEQTVDQRSEEQTVDHLSEEQTVDHRPDKQPAPADRRTVGESVWQTPEDPDEAAIKTRVVARRELMAATRPVTATLEWDSGARLVVGGAVLIGREPVPQDGEQVDRRLAVGTDSMGVSKTHLLLLITTTGITVVDRFSTNGVRVQRVGGGEDRCPPGEPVSINEGDKVLFGGRWIVLATAADLGDD